MSPEPAASFGSGCQHPPGSIGRLDESARRLSHEEYAVAGVLASEGHDVRSLREPRGKGPQADLLVCGATVEVKSWDPLDLRQGRVPTARSVYNKLVAAGHQSPTVALYSRGRGTTADTVREGLAMYAADPAGSKVTSVRVLGDGFDLSWSPPAPLGRSPARRQVPARRHAGRSLGL